MAESLSIEQETDFKHNQIIWGKVTGHPWWPGILNVDTTILHKKLYRVDFFGDPPTHSILPASKIIKYDSFEKGLNNGRASPQLKRAVTEASILYSTLQESRCSCDNNDQLAKTSHIDSDPLLSSVGVGGMENEFSTPRRVTCKRIIQYKSASSVETSGNACPRKLKHKKVVKKHRKEGIVKRMQEGRKLKRQNKQLVKRLLKEYRLENIPKPDHRDIPKPINTQKLVMRKVYKLLRTKYSGQKSIEKALQMKGKITKASDFHDLVNLIRGQTDIMYTDI